MELIRQILATRLRDLRKAKGWTQEKLAESAGMAKTHVAHLETGRRWPSPTAIVALAGSLGVSEPDLFADPALIRKAPEPTPAEALAVISRALALAPTSLAQGPNLRDLVNIVATLSEQEAGIILPLLLAQVEGARDPSLAEDGQLSVPKDDKNSA
jgi:transcriptional regulator with XRE-family HTH domain